MRRISIQPLIRVIALAMIVGFGAQLLTPGAAVARGDEELYCVNASAHYACLTGDGFYGDKKCLWNTSNCSTCHYDTDPEARCLGPGGSPIIAFGYHNEPDGEVD